MITRLYTAKTTIAPTLDKELLVKPIFTKLPPSFYNKFLNLEEKEYHTRLHLVFGEG
jgi:hypothetical protein